MSSQNAVEHQKILVCGQGGVGKSALVIRYTQDHFLTDYDPTIENLYRHQTAVDGESRMLELLDQAGREDYIAIYDSLIRRCQSAVVCFSITNSPSLAEACLWLDRFKQCLDVDSLNFVILSGNKSDLEAERKVSRQDAEAAAKKYGCKYMETSSKERTNVDELFRTASRLAKAHSNAESNSSPDHWTTRKGPSMAPRCIIL